MALHPVLLRFGIIESTRLVFLRNISFSRLCLVEQDWRYKNGLPRNPNAYGPLTDGQDFTFLDGRPTPIGIGQRNRLEKHKTYAEKILRAVRDMDFAVKRAERINNEKENEKSKILGSKLKPKGHLLLSSKK